MRSTGRLCYKKVLGTLNPSDVLAKHVSGDMLDAHLKTVGMELQGGREETAATPHSGTLVYLCDWIDALNQKKVSVTLQ